MLEGFIQWTLKYSCHRSLCSIFDKSYCHVIGCFFLLHSWLSAVWFTSGASHACNIVLFLLFFFLTTCFFFCLLNRLSLSRLHYCFFKIVLVDHPKGPSKIISVSFISPWCDFFLLQNIPFYVVQLLRIWCCVVRWSCWQLKTNSAISSWVAPW